MIFSIQITITQLFFLFHIPSSDPKMGFAIYSQVDPGMVNVYITVENHHLPLK